MQPISVGSGTAYTAAASQSGQAKVRGLAFSKHNTLPADPASLPASYFTAKGWIASPTEEQLAAGGIWVIDPLTRREYFQCGKEKYQTLGLEGIRAEIADDSPYKALVTDILDALEFLPGEKRAIADLISKAGKEAGLSAASIRRLKIDTDSSGRLVVGGLKDRAALKAMEKALNNTEGLAARIGIYQKTERKFYADFERLPVQQYHLSDGKTVKPLDWIEQQCAGAEDFGSLTELGPTEYHYAAAVLFMNQPDTADFSFRPKGVGNPAGDLERVLTDIRNAAADRFLAYNRNAKKTGDGTDRISWDNVTIRITENGKIEFEGRFGTSEGAQWFAENTVREILRQYMQDDEAGREGIFATALQRISTLHDDEYGEAAGMRTKEAVCEFSLGGGRVSAWVENENAEAQIKHDLQQIVFDYLREADPDLAVSKADFTVGLNGTVTWRAGKNVAVRESAAALLAELTERMRDASRFGENILGTSTLDTAASAMNRKLKEAGSYGPDGQKSWLNYLSADDEDTERARQDTAARKAELIALLRYYAGP